MNFMLNHCNKCTFVLHFKLQMSSGLVLVQSIIMLILWQMQVEQKQEHALRPLPTSLLKRVRELAKIHPYPRVRMSKKSSLGQVAPLMLPGPSKGAPSNLGGGRTVRRKNCT